MSAWAGRVAFVLAAAVGIGWSTALVLSMLRPDVSSEAATLLSTVGGVLAGGVAAYLGNATSRDTTSRTRQSDAQTGDRSDNGRATAPQGVPSDLDTQ